MEPLRDEGVRDPLGSPLARAAFEAATQGLLVLDPAGIVLAANAAFGGIYGLDVPSLVGRHYAAFADSLDVRRHDGAVGPESWVTRRALKGERVAPVVQTIRNLASGREFVARCGASPTVVEGRFVATTVTVEDVTGAVRAQEAVAASLSSAEVGTYRIDLVADRVYGDANFARLCGLTPEEAQGGPRHRLYERVHPDDAERVMHAIGEATLTGEPHETEYRVVRPDGEVRWLLSRGRAEIDAQGRAVQRLGSVMDVTGRKNAEEALRAQTARYEAVIEAERRISEADGDYGALLAFAVEEARRLTGADGACLEIEDGDEMVYEAACGMAEGFVGLRLASRGSLSGKTVAAGESSRCDDAETDDRVDRVACRRIGVRSMALAPLRYDQRGFGVLKVMAARPNAFGTAETQSLDLLSGFLGAAVGRARASEALRQSEERQRATLDALPALVFHIDADLVYRFANLRFEEWFGRPRTEAVGRAVREAVGEETFAFVEPHLRRALAGERAEWDAWIDFPLGRRYVRTTYVPTRGADGRIVGLDVLSADRTQERLAQEALADAKARTDAILASADVATWVLDVPNDRLYADRNLARFFDLDEADANGGPAAAYIAKIHPDDQARVARELGEAITEGVPYDIEYRILAGGEERWVAARGIPERGEDGTIVRLPGVVVDVTQLKAAQEREREAARALREANESLELRVAARTQELTRANRDLDQFAYSVAHDLRAPLRNIVSTSRMILEDAEDRLHADEANLLRRQAASGVRLAKIVDDLLGFARLAQTEPRRTTFDLTAVARAAAEQVRTTRGPSCGIVVQEGMSAQGDPSLVGYVLTNLLDNACKFSPAVGSVSVGEEGGAFFVRDKGVGFDMAHAHKLFVAFERLVGQGEFEGTGVGLANVRRIVEKHGGRVWAESEPGKGATFFFTLDSGSA